jgi:hypothetical protein
MTNYVAQLEVRHATGFPPHTFLVLQHPNGEKNGYGFAPHKTALQGKGQIQNDTNHHYNVSSSPIPLTAEQYNHLVKFINQSAKNPPYYNLPKGIQCTNWAMDAMIKSNIMDDHFLMKSKYGRILLSHPWNQGIAQALVNVVDEAAALLQKLISQNQHDKHIGTLSYAEKLQLNDKFALLAPEQQKQAMQTALAKDQEFMQTAQTSATSNFGISPTLKAQLDEEMQQKNQQSQGRPLG